MYKCFWLCVSKGENLEIVEIVIVNGKILLKSIKFASYIVYGHGRGIHGVVDILLFLAFHDCQH